MNFIDSIGRCYFVFPENQNSIIEVLKVFDRFSKISGLKPSVSKCEIARIGGLKWVDVARCGTQCINLKNESLKILGIHFPYNKNLEQELAKIVKLKVVIVIVKIKNVLKL